MPTGNCRPHPYIRTGVAPAVERESSECNSLSKVHRRSFRVGLLGVCPHKHRGHDFGRCAILPKHTGHLLMLYMWGVVGQLVNFFMAGAVNSRLAGTLGKMDIFLRNSLMERIGHANRDIDLMVL